MKVLCLPEPGNLVIKDLSMSESKEGRATIEVEMCSICGSDVTIYRGVNPTMRYPINGLGHKGVGIVQEIGENDKGLKPGNWAALEPYAPCNKCHMYATGRFNNCADLYVCDVHKDGMISEYLLHPVQLLYKLPDELTFTHVVLVEPLAIGLHGAARARVSRGEHCAAFGAGIIGLMAAFACINHGAIPILVDVLQKRLDHAKELGVPCTFSSGDGNVEEYLRGVTNGKLPEAMIDCAGTPVILESMHNYVCHGGRTALVGWSHDPARINTVCLMQKEINVCPSRNSNGKFPEAVSLANEGRVSMDATITKTTELDQVEDTIKDTIQSPSDYLKVIVST